MIRRLFRWAFRLALILFVLTVLAVVAGILMVDTIARQVLVSRIHNKTGMEVKITAVHLGLRSSTLSVEGLKLYNRPEFGGSLCLDMPDFFADYDISALRSGKLHLRLLRFNLAELAILETRDGKNNFSYLPKKIQLAGSHSHVTGKFDFLGIDTLNVSLGKFRLTNISTGRGEEIDFNIKNQIVRNVKNEEDLAPLGVATLSHAKASGSANADGTSDLTSLISGLMDEP
jgi:hypothetical protein